MDAFYSFHPMCDAVCGFECYGMCGFDPVAIAAPHNMAWAMVAVLPPL